jgi:peptidoglycan/xylan/chitin deacetylase (PgdA/CDA1 family)
MALIIQLPGITEVTVSASRKPENGGIAVPIIIYHNIRRINLSELTISPCEFENDLIYLKSNGFSTITIDDLIGYQKGTEALPKKPIVICFDDGYLNTYAYAFPLLKAYGMRAVLSIIGKDTDDFSEIDIKDLSYAHANWKQIAEMKNSGVFEIQNHSYNLHLATSKRYGCTKNHGESPSHYEKVLTDDLNKLQQEVYENTGYMPTAFTYPFGRISDESIPIIKKLGFKASLTCDYGINIITKDPEKLYGLKRIARYHNISLKKTLAEGFKTLE